MILNNQISLCMSDSVRGKLSKEQANIGCILEFKGKQPSTVKRTVSEAARLQFGEAAGVAKCRVRCELQTNPRQATTGFYVAPT